jgi:hypothetical protein
MLAVRISRNFLKVNSPLRNPRFFNSKAEDFSRNTTTRLRPGLNLLEYYNFNESQTHLLADKPKLERIFSHLPPSHDYRAVLEKGTVDPNNRSLHSFPVDLLMRLSSLATSLPSNEMYQEYIEQVKALNELNQIPKESSLAHKLFFQMLYTTYSQSTIEEIISCWHILVKNGYSISASDVESVKIQLLSVGTSFTKQQFLQELFQRPKNSPTSNTDPFNLTFYQQSEKLESYLLDLRNFTLKEVDLNNLTAKEFNTLTATTFGHFKSFLQSVSFSDVTNNSSLRPEFSENINDILNSLPTSSDAVSKPQFKSPLHSQLAHSFSMINNYFLTLSESGIDFSSPYLIQSLEEVQKFLQHLKAKNFNEETVSSLSTFLLPTPTLNPAITSVKLGTEAILLTPSYLMQDMIKKNSSLSTVDLFTQVYLNNILNQLMLFHESRKSLLTSFVHQESLPTEKLFEAKIISELEDKNRRLLHFQNRHLPALSSQLSRIQLELCLMESIRRNLLQYWNENKLKYPTKGNGQGEKFHLGPDTLPMVKRKLKGSYHSILERMNFPASPTASAMSSSKLSEVERHYSATALHILSQYYLSIPSLQKNDEDNYEPFRTAIQTIEHFQKHSVMKSITNAMVMKNIGQNVLKKVSRSSHTQFFSRHSNTYVKEIKEVTNFAKIWLVKLEALEAERKKKSSPPSSLVESFLNEVVHTESVNLERITEFELLKSNVHSSYYSDEHLKAFRYFLQLINKADEQQKIISSMNSLHTYPTQSFYIEPLVFKMAIGSFVHLISESSRFNSNQKDEQRILSSVQAIVYDPSQLANWIMKNYITYSYSNSVHDHIPLALASLFPGSRKFNSNAVPKSIKKSHNDNEKFTSDSIDFESHKISILFSTLKLFTKSLYQLNRTGSYYKNYEFTKKYKQHINQRVFRKMEEFLSFWLLYDQKHQQVRQNIRQLLSSRSNLMRSSPLINLHLYDKVLQDQKNNVISDKKYDIFLENILDQDRMILISELMKGYCIPRRGIDALTFLTNLHNRFYDPHFTPIDVFASLANEMERKSDVSEDELDEALEQSSNKEKKKSKVSAESSSSSWKEENLEAILSELTPEEREKALQEERELKHQEEMARIQNLMSKLFSTFPTFQKTDVKQEKSFFQKLLSRKDSSKEQELSLEKQKEESMKRVWSILMEPIVYCYLHQKATYPVREQLVLVQDLIQKYLINYGYPLTRFIPNTILFAYVTKNDKLGDDYTEALEIIQDYYNQCGVKPTQRNLRKLLAMTSVKKDANERDRVIFFAESIYPGFMEYMEQQPLYRDRDWSKGLAESAPQPKSFKEHEKKAWSMMDALFSKKKEN